MGGLAARAMGQAIAVTVDATVPDPWKSDASVAVATEGWITRPEAVPQFGPKHRLAVHARPRHHDAFILDERRIDRRPRRPSISFRPRRARPGRADRSCRLIEAPRRAACSPGGNGRPRPALASSGLTPARRLEVDRRRPGRITWPPTPSGGPALLISAQHDQRVVLKRNAENARDGVRDRDDPFRRYVSQRLCHITLKPRGSRGENPDDSWLVGNNWKDAIGYGQI